MNTKRTITAVAVGLMIVSFGTFANGQSSTVTKAHTKAVQTVYHHKKHHSQKWVRNLQAALNKAGYHLKEDGILGRKTLVAIKDFQKKKGLTVTGKPDQDTLNRLGLK